MAITLSASLSLLLRWFAAICGSFRLSSEFCTIKKAFKLSQKYPKNTFFTQYNFLKRVDSSGGATSGKSGICFYDTFVLNYMSDVTKKYEGKTEYGGKRRLLKCLKFFFLLFLPGRETANVHLVPIAWSALVRLSITAIFGERDGGRIFPHIITPIFTYSLGGEIGDGEGEVFLFSLSVPAIILIYVFSASPPSPFFLPLSPKRHPQDTTAERERKERKGQFSKIVFMGSLSNSRKNPWKMEKVQQSKGRCLAK